MELTTIIAKNIIRLLEENNLTQSELSNYLDISRQTLSNYLKGASTIDSVRLVKTAQFFNVPIGELLEDSAPTRAPMLLRSVVRDHDPIDNIEKMIFEYLDRYEQLSSTSQSAKFLPEQHDLYIDYKGTMVSINHDLPKVSPVKFKVDDQLRSEIFAIADYQRRLLGLNDSGAIDLIPALIQRGIKLFFLDFKSTNIFGLSICDSTFGCCIFVNDNAKIPTERQLFTVAHEFAHIILHRPLFSADNYAPLSVQYYDFIDKMADTFAGRLLCPPEIIRPFAKYFDSPDATLKSVFLFAVRLKKKLQISLSSLLISLNQNGILNKAVVSEYFRWAASMGYKDREPVPISEDKPIQEYFELVKNQHIIETLRGSHEKEPLSLETIAYFLNCDLEKARSAQKDITDDFSDFI